MPSPFPGMDPFIESQRWSDFHAQYIVVCREMLVQQVRPKYVVDIERYVYLTREDTDEVVKTIAPDVIAVESGHGWREEASADSATATLEPVTHRIPIPELGQAYLVIRTLGKDPVVTVIELLSPSNKSPGTGMAEYLAKRANVLRSTSNLVEIDLLRGGERLPTEDPLQPGDYYAFVTRSHRMPEVDVYAWTVRDRLPRIPVPLADGDADASLDLQAAFTITYDRAGYDYSLRYGEDIQPALATRVDAEWLRSQLPS